MNNSTTAFNDYSESQQHNQSDDLWTPDIINSEVLNALRHGSHNAYRMVYLHWRKPIYYLLFKLTGSENDAEDITQDVFIKLWENHHKVDPNRNIKALLYHIARNLSIKHFEKKRSQDNYINFTEVDEKSLEDSYDMMVAKETLLLKKIALGGMSKERRLIYQMCIDDGVSPDDVAERLGVSRKTVYNQLSAARKELRGLLTNFVLTFIF